MATHRDPPRDVPLPPLWADDHLSPAAQWLSSTRMLALLVFALALTCLAWSAWPLLPNSPRSLDLAMGIPLTALAMALFAANPKLRQYQLLLLLMLPLAALGILTGTRVSDTAVAILSSGWILLAVTAGLYLTQLVLLIAFLVIQAVIRIFATWLNPVEDITVLTSVSLAATLVVAIVVFVLTDGHRRLIAEVRHQAIRDPLTGVLNRRGADLEAHAVRAVAERASTPTTVAVIDLDDFKVINDRYGHQTGDKALQTLTEQWSQRPRSSDVLARIGGDEFLIVMPDTDLAAAASLLQSLHHDNPVNWTSGTTPWAPDETLDQALAEADERLYEAKRRHPSSARRTDRRPPV